MHSRTADADDATATMRAVQKRGSGETLELRTVPREEPGAGVVEVRVAATGICGTDVHIVKAEYAHETPVILGHEITGTVTRVGDEADADWLGRRVACETYYSACETCDQCRRGSRNLCALRKSIGSFADGGFAEYVQVPALNLHEVPEWFDDVEGALMEPLACVTHCLLDPPVVQPGDRVLVTGPGTMGILAAQVARAAGGSVTVSGLEADAARLRVAEELGLDVATGIVPEGESDVVIECSGTAGGAANALRAVAPGGRHVQVGIFGDDVRIPFDQVLYKEVTVSSGFASTPLSWRKALGLVHGRHVQLAPLISDRVPLSVFADAFHAVERGQGMKTVLVPHPAES